MSIDERLKEIRDSVESSMHDSAERVLDLLNEHGNLGSLVRWHLSPENSETKIEAQPQPRQLPSKRTRQSKTKSEATKPKPVKRKKNGRRKSPTTAWPKDVAWLRSILKSVLKHPRGSRAAAVAELAGTQVELPDGTKRILKTSMIYRFINAVEKPTPEKFGAANPVEINEDDDKNDVSKYRNLECHLYRKCLSYSVENKWSGFSCVRCPNYS